MSRWDYRLMMKRSGTGSDATLSIYEVFYDDSGRVANWTEDPIAPLTEVGDTLEEKLEHLKKEIEHQTAAFSKPVLDHATGQPVSKLQD